jgi:hypothetical protein
VQEVETVLAGHEVFAEDQFLKLLVALGLPTLTGDSEGLPANGGQGG